MIREATSADAPAIRALMESIPGFWQSGWSEDTISRAIRSSAGLAFIWEEDSQILGFACAHDLGFRAYLSELAVSDRVRRRGIGQALVQTIERALRGRGATVLIADVWRDAVPFYRSLGWEPPDVVLLRRRLKS